MKRFAIACALALSLTLLSGCMPAVVVTSPKDEEFQEEWKESIEELRRDREEDPADEEDDEDENDGFWTSWASWGKEWEDWSDEVDDRFDGMEQKKHIWIIQDVSDPEAAVTEAGTVTDEEQVKALDDLLGIHDEDTWTHPDKAPDDPAYSYVYRQEKTLLAGQDPDAEREYEDLLRFTVSASEDVVTMQILGGLEELSLLPEAVPMEDVLTFPIAVPAETAEALRNPGRFLD